MTSAPTGRQAEILRWLANYSESFGFAPSIREMCERFGFASTNGAAEHLAALERRGLIRRHANIARSTVLTPAGRRWLAVPETAALTGAEVAVTE